MKRKVSLMAMALLLVMALGTVGVFAGGSRQTTAVVSPSLTSNPTNSSSVQATATQSDGGTLIVSYSPASGGYFTGYAYTSDGALKRSIRIYGSSANGSFSIAYGTNYYTKALISGADPSSGSSSGTSKIIVL